MFVHPIVLHGISCWRARCRYATRRPTSCDRTPTAIGYAPLPPLPGKGVSYASAPNARAPNAPAPNTPAPNGSRLCDRLARTGSLSPCTVLPDQRSVVRGEPSCRADGRAGQTVVGPALPRTRRDPMTRRRRGKGRPLANHRRRCEVHLTCVREVLLRRRMPCTLSPDPLLSRTGYATCRARMEIRCR